LKPQVATTRAAVARRHRVTHAAGCGTCEQRLPARCRPATRGWPAGRRRQQRRARSHSCASQELRPAGDLRRRATRKRAWAKQNKGGAIRRGRGGSMVRDKKGGTLRWYALSVMRAEAFKQVGARDNREAGIRQHSRNMQVNLSTTSTPVTTARALKRPNRAPPVTDQAQSPALRGKERNANAKGLRPCVLARRQSTGAVDGGHGRCGLRPRGANDDGEAAHRVAGDARWRCLCWYQAGRSIRSSSSDPAAAAAELPSPAPTPSDSAARSLRASACRVLPPAPTPTHPAQRVVTVVYARLFSVLRRPFHPHPP